MSRDLRVGRSKHHILFSSTVGIDSHSRMVLIGSRALSHPVLVMSAKYSTVFFPGLPGESLEMVL